MPRFVCRCAKFKLAVSMILKHGNRQGIAFHAGHRVHDFLEPASEEPHGPQEMGLGASRASADQQESQLECSSTGYHRSVVHINDVLTLFRYECTAAFLHILQCVFLRKNLCKGKECRLKKQRLPIPISLARSMALMRYTLMLFFNNIICLCREVMRELFGIPLAVYEEGSELA